MKYGTSERPGVNYDTNQVHLILAAYRPGAEESGWDGMNKILV